MSNIYFDEKTKTLYEYVENTIYKIKSDIFNNMSEITSNEVIGKAIIPSIFNGKELKGIFWDMCEDEYTKIKIFYNINNSYNDNCIIHREELYFRNVKQYKGLNKLTQQSLCFIGFSKNPYYIYKYDTITLLDVCDDIIIERYNDIPFKYIAIY
jgi:hypothetical protein